MSERELVELRVRVAPVPEEPKELREPRPLPRRFLLPHVHADECERLERAALIEVLDGVPDCILVVRGAGDDPTSLRPVPSVPGVEVIPAVVTDTQLARRLARVCGSRGALVVGFDIPWVMGRLAVHAREAKGGGVSLALAGGGWPHRDTGRWCDADTTARLLVNGRFVRWLPPRRTRKGPRSHGGPVIQLDVLGEAMGCDARSPAALADSLGVSWPREGDPLNRLVAEGLVLAGCYLALVTDLTDVAPGLSPWDCWSAGSIVTGALLRAGVRPPAHSTATLPPRAVGAAAAAFHGGEATASLVGVLA